MMKKSLRELYDAHQGKLSDRWESYLSAYDIILELYRDQPVYLLEIGIQNGGSLEIWSEYFTQAQKLVGCDINPKCTQLSYEDPRIKVVVGDANAPDIEAQVLSHSPAFDIVLDDGSHKSSDIVRFFSRYFAHLKDGGVYIAEDLHCSYWQHWEGGLYDPHSAIAFFKLLADAINHEHWGIAKECVELFKDFAVLKEFPLTNDLLAHVHSVEFANSLCIVRKKKPESNRLGVRLMVGIVEQVSSGNKAYHQTALNSPDESGNSWQQQSLEDMVAERDQAIGILRVQLSEQEGQITELKQIITERGTQLAERDRQLHKLLHDIEAITRSTSWQITAPYRWMGHQAKRGLHVWRVLPTILQRGGGAWAVATKACAVFRHEGVSGIKRCWIKIQSQPELPPVVMEEGGTVDRNDYQEWIRRYDTLDEEGRQQILGCIASLVHRPLISIIIPVYDPPLQFLDEAIRSVRNQLYQDWELCIADDASTNEAVRDILRRNASEDPRIRVVYREKNGHISAASNSALEIARGEFIALLDHDDLLPEHALFHVVQAVNEHPDAAIIYSDEDKIDESDRRYAPYFKCEFNYELMLSQNMICHLGVYRRDLVTQIDGFRLGLEGAQDYDLSLRVIERIDPSLIVHIPRVLYHWRAIQGSTARSSNEKNYAAEAGRKAVAEHLERVGRKAMIMPAPEAPPMNRVRFVLPEELPLVSILIPTRDRAELLGMCLDSVFTKTSYPNYEVVIIDNGSVEAETMALFERLPKGRVQVIRDDSPFNYSRLNNLGAKLAKGAVFCLMNNDIEILVPDWIEEMMSFALQPDVGCVGARLWYPDGTLQHGGVIVGLGGVAGHSHKYLLKGYPGYFFRAMLAQSLTAVTGACLMVQREIFEAVGGLDEGLAVAFNDIDFCLRVCSKGYRNVWTPYAEMVHHESASRGCETTPEKQERFLAEINFMKERWGEKLTADPAYSPNLTLDYEDFSLAWPPRVAAVAT